MEVFGGILVYDGMWGSSGTPAAGELMPSELYHQGGMRIDYMTDAAVASELTYC